MHNNNNKQLLCLTCITFWYLRSYTQRGWIT